MLQLTGITKRYEIGTFKQTALDGVDLAFRSKEFVCILGPSGSGKTTLLNMIGGLDRYDAGDLLISGKSTRHFKASQWDSYRNHAIGFVFQNYNLITHTSVLANVEVGLTLSGLSAEKRRERALEVLERVGLIDHVYKKPNQLSGGQMQRVAIARALANDPDIILADEPTGAIDSATSRQIMSLIQEISRDKLVIMVTHDEQIAHTYASRVVTLRDGQVLHDSDPYVPEQSTTDKLSFKRTSMAFLQALQLSFSNLKTKKFRTLITAFAGSIGIIGVALVLSLANGLNQEIDRLEMTTLAEFPIQIETVAFDLAAARQSGPPTGRPSDAGDFEQFPDVRTIFPFQRSLSPVQHVNIISDDYMQHIDALNPIYYHDILINRSVNMNILHRRPNDQVNRINTGTVNFEPMLGNPDFFSDNYDVLEGRLPENHQELLLIVDAYNRLNVRFFTELGLDPNAIEYDFDVFLNRSFQVVLHDDYYTYDAATNRFFQPTNLTAFYGENRGIDLSIVGIARVSEGALSNVLSQGIKYHPDLAALYLEHAATSEIGLAQLASPERSLITGSTITPQTHQSLLRSLGVDSTPSSIAIYPVSFEAKEAIRDHLDAFNVDRSDAERIIYTDLAAIVTELTSDVINGISYVLIAFSSISLIVSSIMIGIITYVSVLERTKEIGILRSLGARKRDIARVFNAETTLIGLVAGSLGVAIAFLLTFPINAIIGNLVDQLDRLAVMPIQAAFALIVISVILTLIAGLIPSSIASRKDPVAALRVD
ncbi:MAG: ATP-binding cassette domain-containing protein [Acholeplasmatales bacterium]|nr:MAG: ATP-binding cassette domain-containing protein [Acholeplasmatales bacterium]